MINYRTPSPAIAELQKCLRKLLTTGLCASGSQTNLTGERVSGLVSVHATVDRGFSLEVSSATVEVLLNYFCARLI